MPGVSGMKVFGRIFGADAERMTLQTRCVGHTADMFNLTFVTGVFAACAVRNKILMIDRHKAPVDNPLGNVVAIQALLFDQVGIRIGTSGKVTGITDFFVD